MKETLKVVRTIPFLNSHIDQQFESFSGKSEQLYSFIPVQSEYQPLIF